MTREMQTTEKSSDLESLFIKSGVRPERWIGKARKAAKGVKRTTRGRHHLYVLAFDGCGEDGKGIGLYVGRSRYRPDTRFREHASRLAEKRAARRFRLTRNGAKHSPLALLPSFYEHLNPLSRDESVKLEVALVEAMIAAGVPASRVDGPRDRSENESEQGNPRNPRGQSASVQKQIGSESEGSYCVPSVPARLDTEA